ncbi:ataxin-7-like protein 3 [Saccoglossus kowalevskii]|uniref:SAGA-associated factor 11 homolog n=1 Tax=Saccoglossus kowalevskii TaxID=10224 RepID=A0ABM0GW98_SACKO|nr:PREDICTED: ataxin-7-like protein 3-like [Saccoglossus kowalevskii]
MTSLVGSSLENDAELQEAVFFELIDDLTLGLCFEFHRSCKTGSFFHDDVDEETMKQYEIVEKTGLDVFGQVPLKKPVECICPNCNRTLTASRFAPHLEKCMGMGRNSSRIANRRLIANSGKVDSENDDENEETDWPLNDKKNYPSKKLKKEKMVNSPRRATKSGKNKNGDTNSVHSESSVVSYKSTGYLPGHEALSMEERKQLLMSTCGVISEHTKKMCTRSHRCPQHSDEQRRSVRAYLLGGYHDAVRVRTDGNLGDNDDIHVDIDGYEDSENANSFRDVLHWEGSSANPSPADSNSTASTSSTAKRYKKSKQQRHKKSKTSTLVQYDNEI